MVEMMGMFTLGPPPGRTGDIQADFDRLYSWCSQLAAFLSRQNNYTGILTGKEKENGN